LNSVLLNLLMVEISYIVFTEGLTKRLDKRLVRGIVMIMERILGSTALGCSIARGWIQLM
jgi:hypothetical protein